MGQTCHSSTTAAYKSLRNLSGLITVVDNDLSVDIVFDERFRFDRWEDVVYEEEVTRTVSLNSRMSAVKDCDTDW